MADFRRSRPCLFDGMQTMSQRKTLLLLAASAAIVLGGCREEEQNRVMHIEKGEYRGPADTPLSEDDLRALRQRAKQQSF